MTPPPAPLPGDPKADDQCSRCPHARTIHRGKRGHDSSTACSNYYQTGEVGSRVYCACHEFAALDGPLPGDGRQQLAETERDGLVAAIRGAATRWVGKDRYVSLHEHEAQAIADAVLAAGWCSPAKSQRLQSDYDQLVIAVAVLDGQLAEANAALFECAKVAGADVSDGPPTSPSVAVWALGEVRELRETYDESEPPEAVAQARADERQQTDSWFIEVLRFAPNGEALWDQYAAARLVRDGESR